VHLWTLPNAKMTTPLAAELMENALLAKLRWYGIGAPNNTPAAIVERLNREINASLADPRVKAVLADQGGIALGEGDGM
jgi:hypothetical protein